VGQGKHCFNSEGGKKYRLKPTLQKKEFEWGVTTRFQRKDTKGTKVKAKNKGAVKSFQKDKKKNRFHKARVDKRRN